MNNASPNPESRSFEKELSKLSPFEIKSVLISMAEKDAQCSTATFLNAGRGNPDWLLSIPRKAFFLLGSFAVAEAGRKSYDAGLGILASPVHAGVAGRFLEFVEAHSSDDGAVLLRQYYDYMADIHKVDPDDFVYEMVDGILGDHYPTPPRALVYSELMTRDYIRWAMGGEGDDTAYDLFLTEGSTAGMCYAFESLKQNCLLEEGDRIALLTPCFTPYLEIPRLKQFGLDVVEVSANRVAENGYHEWQYPDDELDKLRDTTVKAVFITNPSNPPSVCLSSHVIDRLINIVKTDNPGLMIVTDDVYGTFVEGFKSLMYVLPYNTLCLYSFSKYFGATGWRLAAMALKQGRNVFDDRLAALPASKKAMLHRRYESLTLEPEKLRFIDRIVADSRLVGLNHTAGLSTPQQIQTALFSAFGYLRRKELQPKLIDMVQKRLADLWSTTGFTLFPDPDRAGYYSEIDLEVWAKKFYGDDFVEYLKAHYEPIDPVVRLAHNTAIVLLNGDGFDGPEWSVRVSLANLTDDAYLKIGTAIRGILDQYHQALSLIHI